MIADAEEALTAPLPMLPTRQLVVLATGWATHIAQEAALKCRESAAAWVEAYPAGEYRHGPIAVADAQTLVWSLTPLTEVQRAAVTATGALWNRAISTRWLNWCASSGWPSNGRPAGAATQTCPPTSRGR